MKDSIIIDPKYSPVGKDHAKSIDSFNKQMCKNNSDREKAKEICECSYKKDSSVSEDQTNPFYQKFKIQCVPDGSTKNISATAISLVITLSATSLLMIKVVRRLEESSKKRDRPVPQVNPDEVTHIADIPRRRKNKIKLCFKSFLSKVSEVCKTNQYHGDEFMMQNRIYGLNEEKKDEIFIQNTHYPYRSPEQGDQATENPNYHRDTDIKIKNQSCMRQ